MTTRILDLDPKTYNRHAIHSEGRVWAETNCYVDVWVELAHALGYEPRAALPFTFTIDFEGDQWTFFKFPLPDLYELFGLDVQELAIYRPLTAHIEEQLQRGRPVLVELDSYYLPDTAGTAYKLAHVKSTVAAVKIDVENQLLGYFHNQSYHELQGEDFAGALRTNEPHDTAMLPPYTEFVKIRNASASDGELLQKSLNLFRKHLELVPATNPFLAFKARFEKDLQQLMHESLETFHNYSFATLRQYGACFGLAEAYLQWLEAHGITEARGLAEPFGEIAQTAKAFQFQLARSMSRKKPLDLSPLEAMGHQWQRGMEALRARFA